METPVTRELLEDAGVLHPMICRRIRLYMRHTFIRNTIQLWRYDVYGWAPPYPPTFDVEALRPSLPFWPRPRR